MEQAEILEILRAVQDGQLTPDEAARQLAQPGVGDLGFARVDLHRHQRCGYPEVIFCEGKTPEWIEAVVARLRQANQDCLATRLNPIQMDRLRATFPEAEIDPMARTFWWPMLGERSAPIGRVEVVTAGTSDLPVAQEAVVTARALGSDADVLADVGVAGIHRILAHAERLARADVIVVCAGMDGALPSVVGGLVDRPVIAVPTSVGYGAAFAGVAPLLTMLNSCSANVLVVNIDAGFKAGYVAALIARRTAPRSTPPSSQETQS